MKQKAIAMKKMLQTATNSKPASAAIQEKESEETVAKEAPAASHESKPSTAASATIIPSSATAPTPISADAVVPTPVAVLRVETIQEVVAPVKTRKMMFESSCSDDDDDIQVLRRAGSQVESQLMARASQSLSQALMIPTPPHRQSSVTDRDGSASSASQHEDSKTSRTHQKRTAETQLAPASPKRRACLHSNPAFDSQ